MRKYKTACLIVLCLSLGCVTSRGNQKPKLATDTLIPFTRTTWTINAQGKAVRQTMSGGKEEIDLHQLKGHRVIHPEYFLEIFELCNIESLAE